MKLSTLRRCLRVAACIFAFLIPVYATLVKAEPVKLVVSILPQQHFAQKVGGKWISTTLMVLPGQGPETYEPTPRQIAQLAHADLYWRIGIPPEEKWLSGSGLSNTPARILDAREGIALRKIESILEIEHEEGEQQQDHAEPHHHHDEGGMDPHIWLDPRLVKHMVASLRDRLIRLAPEHKEDFMDNYQRFAIELDQLDRDIRDILADLNARRFMVFHPAWGYFADAYELQQLPIEVEGKTPGPKTLAAVIEIARQEKLRAILVQPQFSQRAAQTVADSIQGQIVTADPLAEDYGSNLRQVARMLASPVP